MYILKNLIFSNKNIFHFSIFDSPFIWRHWTCPRPGSCWPECRPAWTRCDQTGWWWWGGRREQHGQHRQPACSIPTPLSTKLAGNYFWWQNEWLRRLWRKKRTETQLVKKMQHKSCEFHLVSVLFQNCIDNELWIETIPFHE